VANIMPECPRFYSEQPDEKKTTREVGHPPSGLPKQGGQQPHGGGVNKPELSPPQPQRVWEMLEREVTLDTLYATRIADAQSRYSLRPNEVRAEIARLEQEYSNERRHVVHLLNELEEAGTEREKRILHLLYTTSIEIAASGPRIRQFSLEEFQQFRSQVEVFSDEEIREEIRKIEEAHTQLIEEIAAEESNQLPRATMF
jgi:hypothetical protein